MAKVSVARRVWKRWAELSEEEPEVTLALLLSGRFDPEPTATVVERVVRRSEDAIEAAAEQRGDLEFRPGTCTVVPTADGVIVDVGEEPTDFRLLVETICTGLADAGLSGRFDLHEPVLFRLAEYGTVLDCRIRLAGDTSEKGWWQASRDAFEAGVRQAVDWCSRLVGRHASLTLQVHTTYSAVEPDGAHAAFINAIRSNQIGIVSLISGSEDRYRVAAFKQFGGALILIEGGSALDGHGWRQSYESIRTQLSQAADWAVYGYLKRGSRPIAAQLGGGLINDWPEVSHVRVLSRPEERGFEADHVPDLFGCQLLTQNHLAKLPSRLPAGWHLTTLGADAALLEDDDPARWFSDQMPSRGLLPQQIPETPTYLTAARRDLSDLLLTQQTLDDHMAQYRHSPE